MYFNEKEMMEICKRYGIDVIDESDPDYYADDDFSMSNIMKEPYIHTLSEKNIFSGTMEISITLEDDLGFCDDGDTCAVSRDLDYNKVSSVIDRDNGINEAA